MGFMGKYLEYWCWIQHVREIGMNAKLGGELDPFTPRSIIDEDAGG